MTAPRHILTAAALLLLGSGAAVLLRPEGRGQRAEDKGRPTLTSDFRPLTSVLRPLTSEHPFTYTVRFVPAPPGEFDAPTGTPILKRVLLAWSSWPAPVSVQRRDELSDWTTLLTVAETTAISFGLCVDDALDQWRAVGSQNSEVSSQKSAVKGQWAALCPLSSVLCPLPPP